MPRRSDRSPSWMVCVAALAALVGCDGGAEPLTLTFEADASLETQPDRLLIWLKRDDAERGRAVFFEAEAVSLADKMPGEPIRVELQPGPEAHGEVWVYAVAVTERDGAQGRWALGEPALVGQARLRVPASGARAVRLEPFAATCDQDGDYFQSCAAASCCPGFAEAAEVVDCLDTGVGARDSHPFRATAADVCGDGVDEDCQGGPARCARDDEDGDGVPGDADCDDNNSSRYPGAQELCGNGVDEDCDGVDPACDRDGDGVPEPEDCNDRDPTVFPGAGERFCDGRDDDCNGRIDEGLGCDDLDRDGVPTSEDCVGAPGGEGGLPGRYDPGRNEGLEERCGDGVDQDCDGQADEGCPPADVDADRDGFIAVQSGGRDCDDDDPTTYPGAPEVCGDGNDQDCQGGDLPCAEDRDGDGFDGRDDDCDDNDPEVHPSRQGDVVAELCDGRDNDCDGLIDEGNPWILGDGAVGATTARCGASVGTCEPGWSVCTVDQAGVAYIACPEEIRPEVEVCAGDGLDEDCDGQVDEGFDRDSDGLTSCGGDCDDNNPFRYTGLAELCDNLDNDCDDAIDEDATNACGGCDRLDNAPGASCGQCGQWRCNGMNSLRCDDPGRNACGGCRPLDQAPDQPCGDCGVTVCADNNTISCNDPGRTRYYEDNDGDTWGRGMGRRQCGPSDDRPVTRDGDCDDGDPNINPGASEVCDGQDNNCRDGDDEGDLCPDLQVCDGGDGCACAFDTCNGACCDERQECCGDSCCEQGSCCDGACCRPGTSCCNGACCEGSCCDGVCCGPGSSCCDGTCCPDGRCCGGTCCPEGEQCCDAEEGACAVECGQ